jgi:hypothetical protein
MKGEIRAFTLLAGLVVAASGLADSKPCVIGSSYVVRSRTADYGFRLDSAAFALEYRNGRDLLCAPRGKKLLMLKYTLSNPGRMSLSLPPELVGFGLEEPGKGFPTLSEGRSLGFSKAPASMAAGKSVSDTGYLEIPNEVTDPVVLVQVGGEELLRFNLAGRVQPMAGPFAAEKGLRSLDEISAKPGETVAIGGIEMTVREIATPPRVNVTSPTGLPVRDLSSSHLERLICVKVAVKNRLPYEVNLDSILDARLIGRDGSSNSVPSEVLIGNCRADGALRPGRPAEISLLFVVPKSFEPSCVTVLNGLSGGRGIQIRL